MKPKLAIIQWKDAFEGPSGWITYSEYKPEPVFPLTVGWVFDDEKLPDYISVYSTHFDCEEGLEMVVADPNHIPKEMVASIRYLEY